MEGTYFLIRIAPFRRGIYKPGKDLFRWNGLPLKGRRVLRCISVHRNLFIPADQNRYCANSVDPDEKIKSIFYCCLSAKRYKVKISF